MTLSSKRVSSGCSGALFAQQQRGAHWLDIRRALRSTDPHSRQTRALFSRPLWRDQACPGEADPHMGLCLTSQIRELILRQQGQGVQPSESCRTCPEHWSVCAVYKDTKCQGSPPTPPGGGTCTCECVSVCPCWWLEAQCRGRLPHCSQNIQPAGL